ncbi:MAG: hypothetical protein JXA13_02710 [Anaerolineales bacterium]|nr:hypothetical protein [Anaerolineales bacterium]
MKNTTLLIMLVVFSLALSACGSAGAEKTAQDTQGSWQSQDFEMPMATRLAIGTLKLEETDQAITSEQAAELVTLWKVFQSLGTSDTAANEEIEAVIEQIQEALTPEQLKSIAGMDLGFEDMRSVMGQAGFGGMDQNSREMPEGGMPGGGPGPGGGGGSGFGGEQGLNPEQIATAQASRQNSGRTMMVPAPLIEAVITLLESK